MLNQKCGCLVGGENSARLPAWWGSCCWRWRVAGAVLVTVLCCVASLFSLRTELLQVPSQCVESPVYPSPPVYSPGKQGFKSKSTSAPVPLSGSGGGNVVGFDSTSAVKSRRSKNESGLQEGKSPHGSCPVPGCRMPRLSCATGSLGAVGWHRLRLQLPGRTPSPAPGWQEQVKMWMCFFVTSERS